METHEDGRIPEVALHYADISFTKAEWTSMEVMIYTDPLLKNLYILVTQITIPTM
jgi:hypothetical protein